MGKKNIIAPTDERSDNANSNFGSAIISMIESQDNKTMFSRNDEEARTALQSEQTIVEKNGHIVKISVSSSATAFNEQPLIIGEIEDDDASPAHSTFPNKIMRKQRTLTKSEISTKRYSLEGNYK